MKDNGPSTTATPVASITQRVTVEVIPDGSSAKLHIRPSREQPREDDESDEATPETPERSAIIQTLHDLLANHGVIHGIDESLLEGTAKSLCEPDYEGTVVIAEATPPTQGTDGYFEPAFDTGIQPGKMSSLDQANFFERGLLQKARQGEMIGHLVPPRAGEPGTFVTGGSIPATMGTEFALQAGEGVEVVAGREYVALMDGVINYTPGGVVDVSELYEHAGDVDLVSGNLDMEGSLQIEGAIEEQLSVSASRDVIVGGNLEGARLHAGGNLTLMGSVFAGECGSVVTVRGDAAIRSGIGARFNVRGALLVERELARCRVTAGSIILEGGNARIIGGRARAKEVIRVKDVGSPGGTRTELRVGWDVHGRMRLLRRLKKLELEADPESERGDGEESRGRERRTREQIEVIAQKERAKFQKMEDLLMDTASITVTGTVYAGTVIIFGKRQASLDEDMKAVTFRYDRKSDQILANGAAL